MCTDKMHAYLTCLLLFYACILLDTDDPPGEAILTQGLMWFAQAVRWLSHVCQLWHQHDCGIRSSIPHDLQSGEYAVTVPV